MRRSRHFVLAGVAVLLFAVAPGQATWVGINVDIHQDVLSPLPNDFHLVALVCSTSGAPPLVVQTVNGRPGGIQFPYVVVDVQPAGQPDPCWYWLDVNWFFPPGAGYIPYCQVIHLGVLLDVVGENVLIDAFGYFTRDGIPVGQLNPALRNKGFVPIIGFDVPEMGEPRMRIVNGRPTWLPPPPLPILPPPEIPLTLKQIDMFAFPPGFPPPFEELWTGGQQQQWPWTFVVDANGNRIYDDNPLDFQPESFFDIFLEVPMPPIPPGTLRTIVPVVVEPGGFLVSRQRMSYIGNNNNPELTRWVWEVHGAAPAEACCFSDGSCQDLVPAVCTAQGGTPQGPGTTCASVICLGPPACCFPDGSCIVMPMLLCQDLGGAFAGYVGCNPNPCPPPPVGACCIGENCSMTTQFECATLGGQWLGGDADCFPNPCVPPADYWIRVQDGIVIEQGGTGYAHEWFLYPGNWWNQWWPNEFALGRPKEVTLTYTIDFPLTSTPPVVAFNFAREDWADPLQPPLPQDDPYVIRLPVDPPVMQPGTYTSTIMLPFCPRWVSVDVQGMTFAIQGVITHVCLAPVTGACCVGPVCSITSEAQCLGQGGVWLGAGKDCFPNPCVPPRDYWLQVEGGVVLEQGGTGFAGQWFLYPNNWWNQWWPNEFALNRQKLVVLTFDIEFPPTSTPPVVAFNFAREDWPDPAQPPLPQDDFYVIRLPVDPPVMQPGTYTSTIMLPFCPRWVSVDVQGMTFAIQGDILHVCQSPAVGACCVGWDCSLRTQAECAALHGRYLGDGSTCGPPNPCEIRDVVTCEPQPPTHPTHYWYDVTPGDFGRCDFHVRVYDPDPSSYTNVLKPAATWQFAVHQLPNGEWWASWWDPDCQNAIFQTFRFGFDNPREATWDGWATTIGGNNDPYDWQIDNWTHHAGEPDGYGYRVHVPGEDYPLGACCFADGNCQQLTQGACMLAGGISWRLHVPCDPNPCPPPNDNCPAQIPVGDVTGLPFDTTNATLDGPNHCQMTKNIWYCYTAPCTGWARIDTCGSSFDTKLAVHHDCYCYLPQPMMMCCDDNGCGLQSVCYIPVTATHGYLIEVGGAPGSPGGPGVLNIQCFPSGACCFGPHFLACDVRSQQECEQILLGFWHPGADCSDINGNGVADVCEPPMGACCFGDGTCIEMWQFQCMDQGAALWLEGVPCLPDNPCPQPPPGACCWGPGNAMCVVTNEFVCAAEYQGSWHGPGTTCEDLDGNGIADICEPPAGPEACCLPDGGCAMLPLIDCIGLGGRPRGAGTMCLGDVNGDGTDDICDLKWLQPPDLRPVGLDVNATFPYVLADDWLCEQTGAITEFTIWASWFQDLLPGDPMNVHFWLAVHLDIPDPDGPGPAYSMPGPVVWARPFPPGSFLAVPYQPAVEGWLTPPSEYIFPGDTLCWLYRFRVPQWEAFVQRRNPVGVDSVYWLEVQAQVPGGPQPAMFGWKTTWKHWNDDAVWTMGPAPSMGPWQELRYPPLHPLFPGSIDLAFGLHELRVCPGDVNSDGVVDFDDIDPFVEALSYPGGVGWPHEHWLWLNADCDGDGDVDFDDIDPFVARIGTVCPP